MSATGQKRTLKKKIFLPRNTQRTQKNAKEIVIVLCFFVGRALPDLQKTIAFIRAFFCVLCVFRGKIFLKLQGLLCVVS